MASDHHVWTPNSDPPLIRPHSVAKHRVLRAYLERYVSVLTANPAQEQFRLTLVDGFAGGGVFLDPKSKDERPGSPLIMLEAMEKAAAEAQVARQKPFHLDVEYFFIEKNREALDYLRNTLSRSRFAELLNSKIHILEGEFLSHVPSIVDFVKGRGRADRAIFLLDQLGYTDVPLPTIQVILGKLKNAEVILTFATDFMIDYINGSDQTQRTLEKIGITLPPKTIVSAKEERDWRRVIQFALHRQIPERTGAGFYTPFFIRSADSHRDLWLIHLSGHSRARDVMVGLHWQEGTSFAHYGRSGLRMLGYDQELDSEWTGQQMLPGFFFDQTALVSSQDELLWQLPERLINDYKDGIDFNSLFSALTNECPVTAETMRGVLNELAKSKIIQVRDKSGSKARRAAIQHPSDIIVPSSQMRFILE